MENEAAAPASSASPLPTIYKLRAVLKGVSPLIWRHLLVSSDFTLADLHRCFQLAFGWSDEHLHRFQIHGKEFGSMGRDPRQVRLSEFRLRRNERFTYVYDFTDHWEWEVRLLEVVPVEPGQCYPACVGGKRAAPPEDCGGPEAYMRMLDNHKYDFPMDAIGVMADAMSRVLEADENQSVRKAVGDLDALEEAVHDVHAYQAFKPDHFRCRDLNLQGAQVVEGRRA